MKRLDLLRKMYYTFNSILSYPTVTYDSDTNKVYASDRAWGLIIKEHSFAAAYRTYGESKMYELTSIFGGMKTKEEPEVIEVSSDGSGDNIGGCATNSIPFRRRPTTVNVNNVLPPKKLEYANYASDSEESAGTQCSTANTNGRKLKTVKETLNQVRRIQSNSEFSTKMKGKMSMSSTASNDPLGYSFANPKNV
ncbi:hypothetical protein ACP275_12G071400 [Erythranthe tilingii]